MNITVKHQLEGISIWLNLDEIDSILRDASGLQRKIRQACSGELPAQSAARKASRSPKVSGRASVAKRRSSKKTAVCRICLKSVKERGLGAHMRKAHGVSAESADGSLTAGTD